MIPADESENDKLYARNGNALCAKLLMGFITAVLRAEMTYRTRELSRRKGNLSIQKMLLALERIIMYRVNGHYPTKHSYTSLQQEILNALEVKKESVEAVVKEWNTREKK